MSDQPAGGTASTDENHLETFMDLLNDCRNVAVRVFPRYREMFPEGMKSMYSLDPTLANASLPLKIRAMRDHLDFLKSLDDSPLFGPGVHQMDEDPPAIPSRTVTMREPVAAVATAAAAQGQASGSHTLKPPPGAGRGLPSKRSALAPAAGAGAVPQAPVLGSDVGTAHDPPPPMPPSFGRFRKTRPNLVGQERTDPQDYWNFSYRALSQS